MLGKDRKRLPEKCKMFSVQELADYINIERRTIYKEIVDGKLKARKVRGQYRISMLDIWDYLGINADNSNDQGAKNVKTGSG